jgi:hypothetical protein
MDNGFKEHCDARISGRESVYQTHIEALAKEDWEWHVNAAVGEITAVLMNLRADLQGGLLSSIVDQTRAEVFDSFLDHARAYLAENRKNEAGVISGVVFEDTCRRIARNHGVDEASKNLDGVISALVANGVVSSVMAKRARVAAHVRTKATHAQWDEFDTGAVEATIAVTDELVLQNLDGRA